MKSRNQIIEAFSPQKLNHSSKNKPVGPIGTIAQLYVSDKNLPQPNHSGRLLGFVLKLVFDEVTIVTCDPWKSACGGVPRNSFIIIRLAADQVRDEDRRFCDRLIMARITDSVPTPVDSDITQTIYQIHKAQANIDPITNKELQWSAMKASVIGTFPI
ncbi:MAG: hypothetical protein AAFY56_15880, partial [Pseudomonadota bacterium]